MKQMLTFQDAWSSKADSRLGNFRRWIKPAGFFYVASILVHTAAAVALLGSWNLAVEEPSHTKQLAASPEVKPQPPQVVRLELGIATVPAADMDIEILAKKNPLVLATQSVGKRGPAEKRESTVHRSP